MNHRFILKAKGVDLAERPVQRLDVNAKYVALTFHKVNSDIGHTPGILKYQFICKLAPLIALN